MKFSSSHTNVKTLVGPQLMESYKEGVSPATPITLIQMLAMSNSEVMKFLFLSKRDQYLDG